MIAPISRLLVKPDVLVVLRNRLKVTESIGGNQIGEKKLGSDYAKSICGCAIRWNLETNILNAFIILALLNTIYYLLNRAENAPFVAVRQGIKEMVANGIWVSIMIIVVVLETNRVGTVFDGSFV